MLGDLAQCKHSTICCSDIWSGLAKSDSEREKSAQEDQCKTTVQEETGEWGEGERGRVEDEREKGKTIYKNRGEWELRGERRTGRGGQGRGGK